MNALIRYLVWKFLMRHPLLVGVIFISMGLYVVGEGFNEGARYAEFDGGSRVLGRVVKMTYEANRTPKYAAEVAWSAGEVAHEALIEAPSSRGLSPGSNRRLVVSKKDPEKVISAEVLSEAGTLSLVGLHTTASSLGPGVILVGLGVACVLLRHRMTAAGAA